MTVCNTKIIAFSGKKQSGKSSAQKFLIGAFMKQLGLIDSWAIDSNGELCIPTGDDEYGIYDIDEPHDVNINHVWPHVRPINFADPLKEIAIQILGLEPEQVYGSEEQKNTPTHLLWENLPENHKKTGNMTGRDVLQYLGTDIFRRWYNNVWVDTLLRTLNRTKPEFAIISDLRFPNELHALKSLGANCILLLRAPFQDSHSSENMKLSREDFSLVIDNSNLTMEEKHIGIFKHLRRDGIFNFDLG